MGIRYSTAIVAVAARTLVVVLGLMVAAPISAAAPGGAGVFIATLGTQAIQMLGPSVPPSARIARFRQLFQQYFDVPGIARFSLGRYWPIATPQQRQEFLVLFQEFTVRIYSARLGEYGGASLQVIGGRPAEGETVVASQIYPPNGAPIRVDWYLIDRGGQYKITDVHIGGLSMRAREREVFAAWIERNDGRIDSLLAVLRQQIAQAP